ncbi:MAG: CYTH domain-containing protein [Lachnospiraceae bacterium]|nr:CYTH domain-containing protein [Lachnospiraceae bacterium]
MQNVEIERKYLVRTLPDVSRYAFHKLEQAYLCTSPVVRVRKEDDHYYMTYKGKGFAVREEYNLPLTEEAYLHLKAKTDGNIISKTRYLIPDEDGKHTIELDVFDAPFAPLILAEVEFDSEEDMLRYQKPSWLGEDVTEDRQYANSNMSKQIFS